MGGRGKADRQAPRFAHREDEGVVVGSQQSDEKEEGVKTEERSLCLPLGATLPSFLASCISYMTDSVFDRPTVRANCAAPVTLTSGQRALKGQEHCTRGI